MHQSQPVHLSQRGAFPDVFRLFSDVLTWNTGGARLPGVVACCVPNDCVCGPDITAAVANLCQTYRLSTSHLTLKLQPASPLAPASDNVIATTAVTVAVSEAITRTVFMTTFGFSTEQLNFWMVIQLQIVAVSCPREATG